MICLFVYLWVKMPDLSDLMSRYTRTERGCHLYLVATGQFFAIIWPDIVIHRATGGPPRARNRSRSRRSLRA